MSDVRRHWNELSPEEQIRFWEDYEAGIATSFLVAPGRESKKKTKRRRGEHSTKPKCENPSWFRPDSYKALGGQLGHAYNRLVKKDPVTVSTLSECTCRCIHFMY